MEEMTKQKFLNILARALAGSLSSTQVTEHVTYYTEYIEMRMRKGDREEEILQTLGDPRLLAKTITELSQKTVQTESSKMGKPYGIRRRLIQLVNRLSNYIRYIRM